MTPARASAVLAALVLVAGWGCANNPVPGKKKISMMSEADFGSLSPTLEPALVALANLSRNAAVTVISRQPGHLAIFEVRLRRVGEGE